MPETTINPTVGRVVWFYPTTGGAESGFTRAHAGEPLAAVIAHVHSPKMVNLAVFDANGVSHSYTSVDLFQADDALPATGRYCTWMPFQKAQAAKTEELQAQTTASAGYIPRTHRQDLEMAVAHAVAEAVGDRRAQGKEIGRAVRESLDALLGAADAAPVASPVVETKAYADGTVATGTAPLPNTSPVTEQELAATAVAPRVTEAELEAEIASEWYFSAREGVLGELASDGVPPSIYEQANAAPQPLGLLTFCVLVLRNGFTVTGESACASAANFDPDVGRRLARKHAVGKVWPLLGFRLRDKLSGHA